MDASTIPVIRAVGKKPNGIVDGRRIMPDRIITGVQVTSRKCWDKRQASRVQSFIRIKDENPSPGSASDTVITGRRKIDMREIEFNHFRAVAERDFAS